MAFWKKFYKSKYTGAEIDAAVAKAGDATKVVANPTLAGTEAALEGLQVGDTKYKVNGNVMACYYTAGGFDKSYTEQMQHLGKGGVVQWNIPKTVLTNSGYNFDLMLYPTWHNSKEDDLTEGGIWGAFTMATVSDAYLVVIELHPTEGGSDMVDIHSYILAST